MRGDDARISLGQWAKIKLKPGTPLRLGLDGYWRVCDEREATGHIPFFPEEDSPPKVLSPGVAIVERSVMDRYGPLILEQLNAGMSQRLIAQGLGLESLTDDYPESDNPDEARH